MKQSRKTYLNHHQTSSSRLSLRTFSTEDTTSLMLLFSPRKCFRILTCYYFLLVLLVDYFFSKSSHFCFWQGCLLAQKRRIYTAGQTQSCPNSRAGKRLAYLSEGKIQSLEVQVKFDAIKSSIMDWKLQLFKKIALHQDSICDELITANAAHKLLQSCPSLHDPIDGSPPGSTIPGILQARTLE